MFVSVFRPKSTTPTATPVIQQPQYATCMQVFLQLPSGQTVPVQIPATITTPNVPQIVQSNPSSGLSASAVASGLLQKLNQTNVTNLAVSQAVQQQIQTQPIQSNAAAQSILLQSPFKQQHQQPVVTTPQAQTSFTKQVKAIFVYKKSLKYMYTYP